MKNFSLPALFLWMSFLWSIHAEASHLRAGEITATRDPQNPFRYCFTLTTYTDIIGDEANRQTDPVIFYFGDGKSAQAKRRNPPAGTPISGQTNVNYYDICYTYPGNGTYTVGVGIVNRNRGTLNINGGTGTDGISFYVSTTIFVNAQLGFNQTPRLLNAPIDFACVGQRFVHNPGASDPEGDSLAYELTTPQRLVESRGIGADVPAYVDPTVVAPGQNEDQTGAASFRIDPQRGLLTWDAPARVGQYNVAFKIKEYRRGALISETVRDMQILVDDCRNQRPRLILPNDTCVVAGDTIRNTTIEATDPDQDPLSLTSTSAVYGSDFPRPRATFTTSATPDRPQRPTVRGSFNWITSCDHVREQPYDVLFKVEDYPPGKQRNNQNIPGLADLQPWRITVVAPAPRNLRANTGVQQPVTLTWDRYSCIRPGAEILIWRKVGCGYTPGPCEKGLAAGSGFEVVGRVAADQTSFIDRTAEPGVIYAYRISVSYPLPQGGASLASNEACLSLPLGVPIITHVTVDQTNDLPNRTDGKITVRWTRPQELDQSQLPGPYAYQLQRATGLDGEDFTSVSPLLPADLSGSRADTVYQDQGLDTRTLAYRYRIVFYYSVNGTNASPLDTSSAASSVRLDSLPLINAIQLSWRAAVPWSNDNFPHFVYRESRVQPGRFQIIAQVNVQGPTSYTYTDDGVDRYPQDGVETITLSADSAFYCYKVLTLGSYANPRIRPDTLRNFSQEICALPRDTVRPCSPVLSIDSLVCSDYYANQEQPPSCGGPYQNQLSWTYPATTPQGLKCKEPVAYRLYYARYQGDSLQLLVTLKGTPLETSYLHSGLTSYAGCYYVTAVDRSGNESLPSNIVCKDNCPYYELPNVITPNGDGENDVFQPYPCPQFVESVDFSVYNRWGRKVFEVNNNILLNWDGRLIPDGDRQGQELSTGVYYYLAKVRFQRLRREDEVKTLKGWVQILK